MHWGHWSLIVMEEEKEIPSQVRWNFLRVAFTEAVSIFSLVNIVSILFLDRSIEMFVYVTIPLSALISVVIISCTYWYWKRTYRREGVILDEEDYLHIMDESASLVIFAVGMTFVFAIPPLLFVGYGILGLSCTSTLIFTIVVGIPIGILVAKMARDWQRKPRPP